MIGQRYKSLDVIRGAAALSVLVTHWSGWTIADPATPILNCAVGTVASAVNIFWKGGGLHPGVIVFIVLSGFCIHLPIAARPSRVTESKFWGRFFLRRIVRLGPVYWLATAMGVLVVVATKGEVHWGGLLLSVSWVSSLAQIFTGNAIVHAGNFPLMTVATEVQLYFSYPLLLWIRRRSLAFTVAIPLVLYATQVAMRVLSVPAEHLHGTYLELLLYWCLGVAASEFAVKYKEKKHRVHAALSTAASSSVFFALAHGASFPGMHVLKTPVLAASTAGLLYILVTLEDVGILRVPMWMTWVGSRSYSLYAVHTPVIMLTLALLGDDSVLARWTALLAVSAVTLVVYRWIEAPSQSYGARLRSDDAPGLLAVSTNLSESAAAVCESRAADS